jgi:chloramphenicol-sensitive protein RarD
MKRGIWYGLIAYLAWGILPIYWRQIQNVPALEIISHRMVWSFIFTAAFVGVRKEISQIRQLLHNPKTLLTFFISALLLVVNWLVYIWAVNAGFIVDASLGYFITPLVNVLLGVVFLREKLRAWQWVSVGIATFGVLYLAVSYGVIPWIGLVLAFTFGFYGFIRKKATQNSSHGFMLEAGFIFIPALAYLLFLEIKEVGALGHVPQLQNILLILTGLITAVPLVMFGVAAQRVYLSTLGFMQYIAPTFQFLIGVLVYGEDFSSNRLIGFSLIWGALLLYSLESGLSHRKTPHLAPAD